MSGLSPVTTTVYYSMEHN